MMFRLVRLVEIAGACLGVELGIIGLGVWVLALSYRADRRRYYGGGR